ncbi:hypothetical protein GCM10009555_037230 [Acrocarpospora macrocephala]|uniref:Uncharacterized protein n=1 Tax=Acrocarpospora macrocephala TaxID=150177 RepID=A0A5M3XC61_9ACTN|nr:hypothetical protein Amac_100510 [Acrocarpospora macrocephala]
MLAALPPQTDQACGILRLRHLRHHRGRRIGKRVAGFTARPLTMIVLWSGSGVRSDARPGIFGQVPAVPTLLQPQQPVHPRTRPALGLPFTTIHT